MTSKLPLRLVGTFFLLASVLAAADPAPTPAAPATNTPAASNTRSTIAPRRIFVKDGQLKSHPFVIFVTQTITEAMRPTLTLRGNHYVLAANASEAPQTPKDVLPGQTRTVTLDGQQVALEGTILIFDLSQLPIPPFKSATRFTPLLNWTVPGATAADPGKPDAIVGAEEIYIGNMTGATLWTAVTIGIIGITLLSWTKIKSKQAVRFTPRPLLFIITGPDGFLSLWRAQLVVWTIAVGSVVFLFGLTRLRVPDIPETLVALMGMSVLTGTLSALRAAPAKPTTPVAAPAPAPAAPVAPPPPPPAPAPAEPILFNSSHATWSDLISIYNKTSQQVELSVPKAQMVFWTAVILVLFVVKSFLLGELWAVPWEMVALTGVSQAGYIGDKLVKP